MKKFLAVLLFGLLMILFSWYRTIDTEHYYTDEVKTEIKDASQKIENYNNKKKYYYKQKIDMYKKRSMIPFYYNKTVLKENKPEIISENCGC